MTPLHIGALAKLAGVKSDTVRFYERVGLLPKPQRSTNGYRTYEKDDLSRIRFIRKAQAVGFSLDEIRRILSFHGESPKTCRCVIAMAESTLSETETKIAELTKFHEALAKNLRGWKRRSPRSAAVEFCRLIESAEIHIPPTKLR